MIKKLILAALLTACVTSAEAWFFYGPCYPCYVPARVEYVPVYRPVVYRPVYQACNSRDAAIGFGIASAFCGIAAACCAASR